VENVWNPWKKVWNPCGKVWNPCGKVWNPCGIHVENVWNPCGKVWNPCGKCMESMEKRYGISIKLVYIPYGFHWNVGAQ